VISLYFLENQNATCNDQCALFSAALRKKEMATGYKFGTDINVATKSAKLAIQSATTVLSLPPKCKNCTLEEVASQN